MTISQKKVDLVSGVFFIFFFVRLIKHYFQIVPDSEKRGLFLNSLVLRD